MDRMNQRVVVPLVSLLGALGCAAPAPYENYPAGSLSDQEVAIVRLGLIKEIKDEAGNTLTTTDKYGSTKHPECRLVPGMYWVRFDHWGMPFHDPRDQNLNYRGTVELKAGHRYEAKEADCDPFSLLFSESIRRGCRENDWGPYMWLEDTTTGEVLIK